MVVTTYGNNYLGNNYLGINYFGTYYVWLHLLGLQLLGLSYFGPYYGFGPGSSVKNDVIANHVHFILKMQYLITNLNTGALDLSATETS